MIVMKMIVMMVMMIQGSDTVLVGTSTKYSVMCVVVKIDTG